jgi:hypothetical protein
MRGITPLYFFAKDKVFMRPETVYDAPEIIETGDRL